MEKFVNDRFCDDIDGSSYKHIHGRLILNTLKYLWKHVETKTENYTAFDDKKEGLYKAQHADGRQYMQCLYANNEQIGVCKQWFRYSGVWIQCNYVNGEYRGGYKVWPNLDAINDANITD